MKVLIPVLVVAVAVTGAFAWIPRKAELATGLDRVGTVIGRSDAKVDQVADITVSTWDDALKEAKIFRVRRSGEGWIIPSHFDYPADADKQIGQTAGILGVTRGRFVTDDPKTFAELGVIDPGSDAAVTAEKRGRRVTLKDGAGAVIVDLIAGESAGEGTYYVREADSNEVFTAKIDAHNLRTGFIDWVKPDLLQVKAADIRAVRIKDYSVDERSGRVETRAELTFNRADANAAWTSPHAPSGSQPKKAEVDAVVNELTFLRLAGIRPFDPEWLQPRGFFFADTPALLERPDAMVVSLGGNRRVAVIGNEGETVVTTSNGLTYHLFFGEVALDDAADTSAAAAAAETPADADKPDEATESATETADAGLNRYLVVFVRYDPEADEIAAAAKAPAEGETATDPAKEHQEAVAKANRRFQSFFYVISNASFGKLRPKAETLFEDKPAEAKARGTEQTISAWLAEHAQRPGVTTTASGLQYEVVAKGADEGRQPTDADTVKVRYTGTRIDGVQFDSSGENTAEFPVTGVIAGWTEALKLMRPGAKWKLTIPPNLAYGETGQGEQIGPNEILQFDVELVEIVE